MRIRAYLSLMVAAILIPVMVFSAVSLDMLLKAEREAALKGVRETARIALVSIDRELSNANSSVGMLVTSPYLEAGDLGNFYGQASYADRINGTWTVLLDEQAAQLIDTAVPYGTVIPASSDPARTARVQRALAAGRPQVSNLVRGLTTQTLLVVVDVPVTTPAGRRYVIAQGFEVGHFTRVLDQVKIAPGWLAGVFDRNGMTIAQTSRRGAIDDAPRADLRAAIGNRAEGVIRNVGEGDLQLYTVLERSALSGWTVAVGVPEDEIEATARNALLISLLGLLAAIGCAAGAALLFAQRLSQSIGLAAQSAQALERGAAVGPALTSGVREVDEVGAAIVAAAQVIGQEQQSRLLAEAERSVLFASERAARTVAEQQNRAKDEFLAMLGHELRNPLSAIVNATSVMGRAGMPAESVERARQIIVRQSRHLAHIVDDLLDVGRVHSGKILLARRALRLDALVAAHLSALGERAAQHAITVATEPVWVDGDPTRLEQLVANLVDNAIKYSPAGAAIAVRVWVEGEFAVLTVSDAGIGIGADLLPYVFDLFVQGARTLDRAQGGLGMGLALVRRLATMHDGQVTAHSAGPGQGSTFTLWLPRVAAVAETVVGSEADRQQQQAPPSRRRLLLIEDNADGRAMLAMMLEAQQYTVATAADGAQGLRMAQASPPDIALVDIGLPGIDGYEVARRLRADPATRGVRLVALTGYGQLSDQQRALAAGFDAHLVKPVELEALMDVLEQGA